MLHRVIVAKDGFEWDGGTYRSLSEVARAITGTNWNGPRFFGLRDKADPSGSPRRPRGEADVGVSAKAPISDIGPALDPRSSRRIN